MPEISEYGLTSAQYHSQLEQVLRRILEACADYRKERGIYGRRLASYGFVSEVLLALAEVEERLKP